MTVLIAGGANLNIAFQLPDTATQGGGARAAPDCPAAAPCRPRLDGTGGAEAPRGRPAIEVQASAPAR
jgi:hypothetical protein